jgi:hypothetical protein
VGMANMPPKLGGLVANVTRATGHGRKFLQYGVRESIVASTLRNGEAAFVW